MITKVKLSNGNEIPQIFQGTIPPHMLTGYMFKHWRTVVSVEKAIKYGMGIDTAVAYGNHREVAMGLELSAKNKDSVFLTSKLYNNQQDSNIRHHYENICNELKVNKLSLLLLHWPQTSTYVDSWKQMEELYYEGLVDNIGIANVEIRHLEQLKKENCIYPHIIQIERHPFYKQEEIVKYARNEGICVQAYSPLARMNNLAEEKILTNLADKYSISIPQLVLKWHIQSNTIPVVRSVRHKKIKENIDINKFEISKEDIESINEIRDKNKIFNPMKLCRYY